MLTIPGEKQRFCDGVSRRNFLKIGALGMGGMALPQLLQAEQLAGIKSSNKSIIMVYLPGGPSHTDLYDIKDGAPAEFRGEFKSIPTKVPGVRVCELLPKVAANFDKFAAVRSLVGSANDHSSYHLMTGRWRRNPQPTGGWPSIGSAISKLQGSGAGGTPPYIGLSGGSAVGAGFFGNGYAPFNPSGKGRSDLTLNRITLDRFEDRQGLLQSFDQMRRECDSSKLMAGMDTLNLQAFDVIASSRMVAALDYKKEPESSAEKYESSNRRRSLRDFLIARRLVEAGARFVTLNFGGWDTHSNNFKTLREQVPVLDQGLAAMVEDFSERGMLDDVTIVVWGEFGRTPRVNPRGGRDHWSKVSSVLLAGGGMKTGQMIGATDRLGGFAADRPVDLAEVFATLYHNVGIDCSRTKFEDLAGRPQYLIDPGAKPVTELVG